MTRYIFVSPNWTDQVSGLTITFRTKEASRNRMFRTAMPCLVLFQSYDSLNLKKAVLLSQKWHLLIYSFLRTKRTNYPVWKLASRTRKLQEKEYFAPQCAILRCFGVMTGYIWKNAVFWLKNDTFLYSSLQTKRIKNLV